MRPTIEDVARRAGVSKGAVSFALNDRPGVSEATRLRILQAAEELDWRPRASAKALSVGRAMAIGLIITRPPEHIGTDPFFGRLLAGIEEALAPKGYVLVFGAVTPAGEREAYERLAIDGRVDGMILSDIRRNDPRIAHLAELGVPTVVLGDGGRECPFPSLWVDDAGAIDQAVDHLVRLGHERIAHVSGTPGTMHAERRKRAWRRAMKQRGLEPGRSVTGRFTAEGGTQATATLLTSERPPTAIVYAGDVMAVAGMATAVDLGFPVPDTLSIIGFDDIPLASHLSPQLSTIRQDHETHGRAAAAALIAMLEGTEPPPVEMAAPVFVVRASTGPPADPR